MIKVEAAIPRAAVGGAPPAPAGALPVGTVLAVEAVRDAATNQLLLLFAGRRWTVKPGPATTDLQAGARVMARVVRGEPDVELALLGRPQEVAAALRRELPRQASPMRLLANLEWLASPGAAGLRIALPPDVRAGLEATWQSPPDVADLGDAAGLARAVRGSGAGLEHLLATATRAEIESALPGDWKARLAQLQQALLRAAAGRLPARNEFDDGPLPARHGPLTAIGPEHPTLGPLDPPPAAAGELAQQCREALARVTCNQLASLDGRGFPVLVEIPYRAADEAGLLRLRIDREAATAHVDAEVWSVEFALDLGAQGPLRGRVTLAEGRVSVTLQPESSALAQAIDAHVESLRTALDSAGVAVGKLNCVRSDPVDLTRTGSWLINLRA